MFCGHNLKKSYSFVHMSCYLVNWVFKDIQMNSPAFVNLFLTYSSRSWKRHQTEVFPNHALETLPLRGV